MAKTLFAIATSVAASALTLGLFAVSDAAEAPWRWVIVGAIGILALLASLWALRGDRLEGTSTQVGTNVRAKGDVEVDDVVIDAGSLGDGNVSVGSNVRSGRRARISGVRLTKRRK